MNSRRAGVTEQIQEALALGVLLDPMAHRAMVQEQPGIEIIFQVHLECDAVLLHLKELSADVLFFVLTDASLALPLLADHLIPFNAQSLWNNRQSFSQAVPCGALINRVGRDVFLHVDPALIDIDRQRVLRHVCIVQTVAAYLLLTRPLTYRLHVFLQPVAQHIGTLFVRNPGQNFTRRCRFSRRAHTGFVYNEQQQLRR